MTTDSGSIVLEDAGRVTKDDGSSRRHGVIISVDYHIDVVSQTMTYRVKVNERVVKQVYDVPYSYEELHTQAPEFLFKNMYKGFPNLKIKIDEGEPYGERPHNL